MKFSAIMVLTAIAFGGCGSAPMAPGADPASPLTSQGVETTQPATSQKAPQKIKGSRNIRVLVVDDSATERTYLSERLTKNGYVVTLADSAEQAMNLLEGTAAEALPQIIMMDVVMPGVNGFQLTRQLTRDERYLHIPIIMVTSKNQETDKIWAMRQGARDYIVKPIDELEMLAKIKAFAE